MKKLENILIFLFLIFFFSNAEAIGNLSKDILNFWFAELVPSLFLSIFIIQLLSGTSFFIKLAHPFKFLCPILNTNLEGLGFVFGCLLTGCPASVCLINEAYKEERLTKQMAERLLYCTECATISFLIMSAGAQMLKSQKAGVFLWLIQFVCSLCLFCTKGSTPIIMNPPTHQKKHSVTSALFKTGSVVFLIGGYLLMFQTLSYLAGAFLSPSVQRVLRILSEFSYGCAQIADTFPFRNAFVLISALTGFNGLCVHFQVLSISEIQLNYGKYVLYRIAQAVLSAVLALAVLPLLGG